MKMDEKEFLKEKRYKLRPKHSQHTKDKISKSMGGKNSYTAFHRESREIMEKYLGRALRTEEIIHHIDGDQSNNKIENLELLQNKGKHNNLHREKREKNNYPYKVKGRTKEYYLERYHKFKKKCNCGRTFSHTKEILCLKCRRQNNG